MGKLIIGLVIGLVLGCVATFFMFGGVPKAGKAPGVRIQPPDSAGSPAGTAQIVLKEEFFNHVLETIFRDMNAPAFPLGLASSSGSEPSNAQAYGLVQTGQECASKITVLPNGSGAQTGITFENDRISAPLAFSGAIIPCSDAFNLRAGHRQVWKCVTMPGSRRYLGSLMSKP